MSDDKTFKAQATALAPERRTPAERREPEIAPAELVREHLLEQLEPLLTLRAELACAFRPGIDLPASRERLTHGQTAYDPLEAVGSVGNLSVAFVRATVAVEKAGFATPKESAQARERVDELMPFVAAWLSAEPAPRDRVRATARRAAGLVANAVLRTTSAALLQGRSAPPRSARHICPCCGCAPDVTRMLASGTRLLTCSRCDVEWETTRRGCLGCGATTAPALAWVETPLVGYRMVLCNPCGRYLKEPTAPTGAEPAIERALTAQLDAAAETRGFRL